MIQRGPQQVSSNEVFRFVGLRPDMRFTVHIYNKPYTVRVFVLLPVTLQVSLLRLQKRFSFSPDDSFGVFNGLHIAHLETSFIGKYCELLKSFVKDLERAC
eukprot:Blabericola_migrator_1__2664@NODE_1755_length_3849_cov_16_576150_g1132_i0_p6_GENE_NODE_1755_length_3849_cov_16_576150_g1132_i0NODE_1755_length_3849_cov_16_576150_g1132_i0_p6_ORF_typecomplete_len101_score9_27KNOX2/PF03791_13/0_096_NODE_1755_length_3849_cov_16_576150_g1132_i021342436